MGQVLATSPLLALDDSPDDNRFSFIWRYSLYSCSEDAITVSVDEIPMIIHARFFHSGIPVFWQLDWMPTTSPGLWVGWGKPPILISCNCHSNLLTPYCIIKSQPKTYIAEPHHCIGLKSLQPLQDLPQLGWGLDNLAKPLGRFCLHDAWW
jgi:hypothetical protein